MKEITRFGISMEKDVLKEFDRFIRERGYENRSKAFTDMVREKLVEEQWEGEGEVVGTITMLYDHHQRELTARLIDIQHHHHDVILSSQHIHLDMHHCLEVVVTRATPREINELAGSMRACRGVKHLQLAMGSTGDRLG